MGKYLLILGRGEEELDAEGYYRVEFDTELPDPEWFGMLNASDRVWSVDWARVLDENMNPIIEIPYSWKFGVIEPNNSIEFDYCQLKETLDGR